MMEFLEKTRRFLWLFVELGFLADPVGHPDLSDPRRELRRVRQSVAGNVMKFANGVPTPSLIGIGVILAIIYLVMQRMR